MRRIAAFVALALTFLATARAQDNLGTPPPQATAATGTFKITFDQTLQPEAYTGRVYISLAHKGGPEPRRIMGDWFSGTQVFSMDVKAVAPGATVSLGADCLAFPKSYADAAPGEYSAQAVARRSLDSPNAGLGEGDLYSEPISISFKPGHAGAAELKLTKVVAPITFKETDRVKVVEIDSPLLSKFYGRPMKARAGVVLPKGYTDDASHHYKTLYFIGGFGRDHRFAKAMPNMLTGYGAGDDLLCVVPDPTCALGHSVFADSANNGPRGQSLIEELIPAVEARFHGAGDGTRRFVTGISSGGWSCLWLQVTYPDAFAGCWSHSPDPVDFRDFQRIDLHSAGANMYHDAKGERRPLARSGGEEGGGEKVRLWYDDFVRQETILGYGGQIHSFEAVFSGRGPAGKPIPLFDRTTGNVNPDTARSWEKYDIRLVLERGWPTLGPKLKGKLHIYAGGSDTFYLEGAAKLLKESLAKLGSDATVEILPGRPHMIHPEGMQEMFKAISGSSPKP